MHMDRIRVAIIGWKVLRKRNIPLRYGILVYNLLCGIYKESNEMDQISDHHNQTQVLVGVIRKMWI